MRKPKGFSLIEQLIVGGYHPDHCRHRPSQPVARAYRRKRSLGGGFLGYTCTLTELGPPASGSPASSSWAGILDGVLPSGQKAGYIFGLQDCAGTPKANYTSTAAPVNVWHRDPRFLLRHPGRDQFRR
jgi:hypothetical protein